MRNLSFLAVVVLLVAGQAMAAPVVWTPTGDTVLGAPSATPNAGDPADWGSLSGAGTVADPYIITAGGDDWWDWAERGHVAYTEMVAGDWRLEASLDVLNEPVANEWLKAGIFVRTDVDFNLDGASPGAERERNAFMAVLPDRRNGVSFQYRLDPNNNAMANQDNFDGTPGRIALQRQLLPDGSYMYEGQAYDGANWYRVGRQIVDMGDTPYAGLALTAHDNMWDDDADPLTPEVPYTEQAAFWNVTYDTALLQLPDPAMRTLNFTPPQGAAGLWGLREVWNAGNVEGNMNDYDNDGDPNYDGDGPVSKLNADNDGTGKPGRTRMDYQAPVVNIHSSDGIGHYGNDSAFRVVDPGGLVNYGDVDNISMVMSGKINIPVADWYTFNVNSDDGFELSIDGTIVMEANYGKGWGDVLGQRQLSAGVHDIRVIYWEGGGGASVEVSAAQGFKTGWEYATFNLIGGAEIPEIPAVPPRDYPETPGMAAPFNMVAIYGAGRDPGGAEADVRAWYADPGAWQTANPDRSVFTDAFATVCHRDQNDGNDNIHGFATVSFPGDDPGVSEDNFIVGAFGQLVITEQTEITFITYGDDGSIFRIDGTDGDWYGGGATGDGYSDLPDGFRFDGWGQDAYRTIDLAAGTYDMELFWQEGGGGAHVALLAKLGTWDLGSEMFLVGMAGLDVDYAGLDMVPAVPAGLELVPEPATMALLAFGALALLRRKR